LLSKFPEFLYLQKLISLKKPPNNNIGLKTPDHSSGVVIKFIPTIKTVTHIFNPLSAFNGFFMLFTNYGIKIQELRLLEHIKEEVEKQQRSWTFPFLMILN
jgi:hypothetical protein